ncbi:stage II sporulation protein M [Methanocaldococcus vulcanius]|nr:stage II sporulation protein M [Methanocaldococcus vulcanius]
MKGAYSMMVAIDSLKEVFNIKEILMSPIRNKKVVLFVSAVFVFSLALSYVLIANVSYFSYLGNMVFQAFQERVEDLKISINESSLYIILAIWKNNLTVCFLNYIIGFLSLFVVVVNSYILSYVLYKFGLKTFIFLVLPHGVIEIPALILSASGGILLNIGIINFLINIKFGESREVLYYIKESLKLLLLSIILFLIAGIVEGTITFKIAKLMFS